MTDPIISLDPDTVRLNESVSGTMKLYIYKWLI